MARATEKSKWSVHFHPISGDHVPDGPDIIRNPYFDVLTAATPGNQRTLPCVVAPATHTFVAYLRVVDYERSRSAVRIVLRNEGFTSEKYYMSLAEYMRIQDQFDHGEAHGSWGFVKNGSTTSIVML